MPTHRDAHAPLGVALFFDLGRLADAIAQVVQLGPAHIAPANDLDLGNRWGVNWERSLDPDAVAEFTNRVGLGDSAALNGNDVALEHLDSLVLTLDNAHMNLDFIAREKLGDVGTEGLVVYNICGLHGADSLQAQWAQREALRIGDRRELFQQSAVNFAESTSRINQVRPISQRPMQGLGVFPSGNACMIAAAQNFGNRPTV